MSPLCSEYSRERRDKSPEMQRVYAVMDCAHDKAAALASGTDSADTIASAVADLCASEISLSVAQDFRKHPSTDREELEKSTRKEAISQARIEVLRQRAGHCPPH
jgi:hypothetical protein